MQPEGLCQLKNPNDIIGNQTHNHPTCSTVPQPSAPLHAPMMIVVVVMTVMVVVVVVVVVVAGAI